MATDIAARGIHVDEVGCVVHFDPPGGEKDYLHRSGRTGRAGAAGVVVSLVSAEQDADVRGMQRRLGLPEGLHAPDLSALSDERHAARPVLLADTPARASAPPRRAVSRAGERSGRRRRGSRRR